MRLGHFVESSFNKNDFHILVAKCGKSIGLKGEIKLIIYSDFSEIFTKGNILLAKNLPNTPNESGHFLTINAFNPHKNSIFFNEIDNIDSAKNLTSFLLYSSKSLSEKYCNLGKDEYFWFEIIGLNIVENNIMLGKVSEITRIGNIDYLIIDVDSAIFDLYPHIKAKRFYLPYIARYILDVKSGIIYTKDAFGVLEES